MIKKKVDLQKNKFASSRSSKQKLKKSKRTESSKRWISRQLSDPYVSEAQKRGYRSRSAFKFCLLYTSPSPRDKRQSRMPSSA